MVDRPGQRQSISAASAVNTKGAFGLSAHKQVMVKEYVAGTEGRLTLHFLPGYAPNLNFDQLVRSYAKRTGVTRKPLMEGEK